MTDWQVGMKAVCINAFPGNAPKHGEIFVVSKVDIVAKGEIVGIVGSRERWQAPSEYVTLCFQEFGDFYFLAECFRPVVERKTDISIFRAMLNTAKEPANEPA